MVQSINWLDFCEFVVGTIPVPSQMSGSTKRHFQSATSMNSVVHQKVQDMLQIKPLLHCCVSETQNKNIGDPK
jgi:hypothetical protein